MKKAAGSLLALTLCVCMLLCTFAEAALASGGRPKVEWTYPVSLTALQSPHVILVNVDNLLDKKYKPSPLVKVKNVKRATSATVELEETTANALKEMFDAAKAVTSYTYTILDSKGKEKQMVAEFENGMVLYLKSGYRSYGTQATIYANYLDRNNGVDDGYVAKPGSSEHQSGFCADILNKKWAGLDYMNQQFETEAEAVWMKENCASYGFILRYPKEKEEVTGISYEPWHFRYVGKEVAGYIMSRGISLEEFTVESKKAMNEFLEMGGDIEEQMDYEFRTQNAPPESHILDVYGEDGDPEVSLSL
ncbi:MAG: D-alanyl-D-alanine carboxypeptidase family protein [Clostridiales bacterium]|nr:D-alanyl-D-alanine carboxypeptidase family protein [Clostridiales bacterium]